MAYTILNLSLTSLLIIYKVCRFCNCVFVNYTNVLKQEQISVHKLQNIKCEKIKEKMRKLEELLAVIIKHLKKGQTLLQVLL